MTRIKSVWEDSNNPADSLGKPRIPSAGAVRSAADSDDRAFAEAIRAVMTLPGPTDAERAEAIRRPLSEQCGQAATVWPTLPEVIKAGIVAMVKAVRTDGAKH